MKVTMRLCEFANEKMGSPVPLTGWTNKVMDENPNLYDRSLERIYNMYWRNSYSHPISELGMTMLFSAGGYIIQNFLSPGSSNSMGLGGGGLGGGGLGGGGFGGGGGLGGGGLGGGGLGGMGVPAATSSALMGGGGLGADMAQSRHEPGRRNFHASSSSGSGSGTGAFTHGSMSRPPGHGRTGPSSRPSFRPPFTGSSGGPSSGGPSSGGPSSGGPSSGGPGGGGPRGEPVTTIPTTTMF